MLFQIIGIPFMIATIGEHITNDVFSHNHLVKIEIVKKYLSIRPTDWSLVEWQSDKPGTSIVTESKRWVLLLTVYKRGFITKHQITKQIFQVVHWVYCLFNHIRNLFTLCFFKERSTYNAVPLLHGQIFLKCFHMGVPRSYKSFVDTIVHLYKTSYYIYNAVAGWKTRNNAVVVRISIVENLPV